MAFVLPQAAEAQSGTSASDISTILSISLSLFAVLALIFGLAYIMRRFTGASSGNGQLRVVASMMAGAKERIMVLQVGEEQHLIGVTSQSINHLSTLEHHIEQQTQLGQKKAGSFQDKLVEAMANRINPNSAHPDKEARHED